MKIELLVYLDVFVVVVVIIVVVVSRPFLLLGRRRLHIFLFFFFVVAVVIVVEFVWPLRSFGFGLEGHRMALQSTKNKVTGY